MSREDKNFKPEHVIYASNDFHNETQRILTELKNCVDKSALENLKTQFENAVSAAREIALKANDGTEDMDKVGQILSTKITTLTNKFESEFKAKSTALSARDELSDWDEIDSQDRQDISFKTKVDEALGTMKRLSKKCVEDLKKVAASAEQRNSIVQEFETKLCEIKNKCISYFKEIKIDEAEINKEMKAYDQLAEKAVNNVRNISDSIGLRANSFSGLLSTVGSISKAEREEKVEEGTEQRTHKR